MRTRLLFASAGIVALAVSLAPARAAERVAMVEDVTGATAGVGAMDYLSAGDTVRLGATDVLVVDYFRSCLRETVTGGTVTIGLERSTVAGGERREEKVACDGGQLRVSSAEAQQSGVVVYRKLPPIPSGDAKPAVERTLYATSPVFDLPGGAGRLVIERIDQHDSELTIDVAPSKLIHDTFYDSARYGMRLAPGAIYRATIRGRSVVFQISPSAAPGQTALAGRLLQF